MYIYVLNFSDHSFSGHQTAAEALDKIRALREQGVSDDEIEIVLGDEEARKDIPAFERWAADWA